MKKAVYIGGLMAVLSIVGLAQDTKGKRVSASSSGSSTSKVLLGPGTQLEGELQSAVDAKSSRVGDQVVVKTTKAIKQNGETVVPKGSRLIGRITDVQKKNKSNGGSRVGMVFDRLEGKGLSSPISASIVSITNAAASGRVADTAEADVFGSSTTSTSAGSSGGGLLGGVGRTVGGITNTAGGVLNTTTNTVGGVTNTATQTAGNTVGTVGRTINGIRISNSASGSAGAATTLSSPNQNIRLEKGVTMQLQLNSSVRAQ